MVEKLGSQVLAWNEKTFDLLVQGNLTRTYNLFDETALKELEALHQLVPDATTITALLNPS